MWVVLVLKILWTFITVNVWVHHWDPAASKPFENKIQLLEFVDSNLRGNTEANMVLNIIRHVSYIFRMTYFVTEVTLGTNCIFTRETTQLHFSPAHPHRCSLLFCLKLGGAALCWKLAKVTKLHELFFEKSWRYKLFYFGRWNKTNRRVRC